MSILTKKYKAFCPMCGHKTRNKFEGDMVKLQVSDHQTIYAFESAIDAFMKHHNMNPDECEWVPVPKNERVPDDTLCKKCEKKNEQAFKEVAAGGIYYQCVECGVSGVLKNNQYSQQLRTEYGVPAPEPLGITFESCKEHTPTT